MKFNGPTVNGQNQQTAAESKARNFNDRQKPVASILELERLRRAFF